MDLRRRVEQGEWEALLDPALPLELMVDLGASWWSHGLKACIDSLRRAIVEQMSGAEAADAMVAWATAHGVELHRASLDLLRASPHASSNLLTRTHSTLVFDKRFARLRVDLFHRLNDRCTRPSAAVRAAINVMATYTISDQREGS